MVYRISFTTRFCLATRTPAQKYQWSGQKDSLLLKSFERSPVLTNTRYLHSPMKQEKTQDSQPTQCVYLCVYLLCLSSTAAPLDHVPSSHNITGVFIRFLINFIQQITMN